MSDTNTRELVYLAGLLHDIGKFYPDFNQLWEKHPFYTDLGLIEPKLIAKANGWATAIDLQNSEGYSATQSLKSLFGDVLINGRAEGNKRFGFNKLSLDKPTVLQETTGDLPTLQQEFKADFDRLPTGNLRAFSDTLYHLLRQYTWCIPASSGTAFESISLFHHLKLTGAFTQCLYDAQTEGAIDNKPVQLLCIDLSGIQSFIYNIGSKYAAKSLKGRSFSLQLLLDSIARQLIEVTETTPSHLVYSSGGKFFMLLPHTSKINGILDETEKSIQQAVWDTYQGNLFVCFGRVPFDYNPDSETKTKAITTADGSSDLSKLWQQVTQKAAEQKAQKNRTLILDADKFADLFGPTGKGGDEKQCPITGWEGELVTIKKDEPKIHSTVKTQIDIGAKLKDARFITLGDGGFNLLDKSKSQPDHVLSPFDLLADNPKKFVDKAEYSQLIQPGTKISFLDSKSANIVRSFRFYGGSQQAMSSLDKHQAKNFEELTGIVREEPDDEKSAIKHREGNYNRMAVLRMDVDSLGELFTKGFPAEKAMFSAYATLSGLLDWFFSGYLNTIREDYADWVNIVYSGGDDVFAVGRWDKIIDFADQVQRDFKVFTGRDDLTISAGIVLMRPRYPIGKAADQAGEAEDLAKDFNKEKKLFSDRHEKDAVCLFNVSVGWEEFAAIRQMKNLWEEWLTDEVLSKGILRSMFDWYETAIRLDKQTNQPLNDQSWRWNAAYSLARQRNSNPDSPRNKALDTLKLVLMCNQFTDETGKTHSLRFEAFIVACRWAELTFRDQLNTN